MRAMGGSDAGIRACTNRPCNDRACAGCDTGGPCGGGAGISVLSEGLRFRQWRWQLCHLSAMSGDGIGPRCLVRRQSRIPPKPRTAGHPLQPKEILMRILALTIMAAGMLVAAAPARAQT